MWVPYDNSLTRTAELTDIAVQWIMWENSNKIHLITDHGSVMFHTKSMKCQVVQSYNDVQIRNGYIITFLVKKIEPVIKNLLWVIDGLYGCQKNRQYQCSMNSAHTLLTHQSF